jgi:hypothetical protein
MPNLYRASDEQKPKNVKDHTIVRATYCMLCFPHLYVFDVLDVLPAKAF